MAQCIDLIAQIADGDGGWVDVPGNDLSAVGLPGDLVRFVAEGSLNGGLFSEGAFFINETLYRYPDVVGLDDFHFAVEHNLTEGSLSVRAVLLHDSLGWVD